jgi:hypothetical protein
LEKKIRDNDENGKKDDAKNIHYELNIFKRMKTIYDVKFLKINELKDKSFEYSLIKNIGKHYA